MATYRITAPMPAFDNETFEFEGPLTPGLLYGMIAAFEGFFSQEDFAQLSVVHKGEKKDDDSIVNTEVALSQVRLVGTVEDDNVPEGWAEQFPDYEHAAVFRTKDSRALFVYNEDENLQGIVTVYSWYNADQSDEDLAYEKLFIAIRDKDDAERKIVANGSGDANSTSS